MTDHLRCLIPPGREITIPDALELIHGDYEVVRQPTFYPLDLAGEELRQSRCAYVTIRTDTGGELGSVGKSYAVLQNEEAFRALEPLVSEGVVCLETGGVLRSGADIWMLGRFDIDHFGPVVRDVFADEVVPYCLFSNNHSGRRKACVAFTPIRVVCDGGNGLNDRGRRSRSGAHRYANANPREKKGKEYIRRARALEIVIDAPTQEGGTECEY